MRLGMSGADPWTCWPCLPLLQIRESIKSLFPDRDCFTLVRPVNDEEQLAALDSLPPSQMRPEFRWGLGAQGVGGTTLTQSLRWRHADTGCAHSVCRDGLHRLTQLIFSKAQPKRLGSQILSGPMLAGLTEAYVNAINNG